MPNTNPVDSFKFDLQDSTRRVLHWTKQEMNALRSKASDPLLYVRFTCSREEVAITPFELNEDACLGNTVRVHSGVSLTTGKNHVYRFYYEDWTGYPMEIEWTTSDASKLQNLFIADICSFETNYRNSNTKNHTAYYFQTARGGQTWTVDSTTIAGWEIKLPPLDGYYYVRTTADGTITFTTTKPEEQDPKGDDPEDIDPGPTTEMSAQEVTVVYKKILHNGQILIIRDGKAYSITGQSIKID